MIGNQFLLFGTELSLYHIERSQFIQDSTYLVCWIQARSKGKAGLSFRCQASEVSLD